MSALKRFVLVGFLVLATIVMCGCQNDMFAPKTGLIVEGRDSYWIRPVSMATMTREGVDSSGPYLYLSLKNADSETRGRVVFKPLQGRSLSNVLVPGQSAEVRMVPGDTLRLYSGLSSRIVCEYTVTRGYYQPADRRLPVVPEVKLKEER